MQWKYHTCIHCPNSFNQKVISVSCLLSQCWHWTDTKNVQNMGKSSKKINVVVGTLSPLSITHSNGHPLLAVCSPHDKFLSKHTLLWRLHIACMHSVSTALIWRNKTQCGIELVSSTCNWANQTKVKIAVSFTASYTPYTMERAMASRISIRCDSQQT